MERNNIFVNRWDIIIVFGLFLFIGLASCKNSETKVSESRTKEKLFTLLNPKETGVLFNNRINQTIDEYILNFNYIFNGAGVAVADFNKDGLQDLYFTGNQVSDKLYINKGDFKFEDVSAKSGIDAFGGWHSGVSIVDINNDGYPDIYVCRSAYKEQNGNNKNLLFVNQKNLTFSEEAEKYGIADPGYSMTALFFDMDRDNDLDLVVSNRPDHWEIGINEILRFKKQSYTEELKKVTHQLYRNEGTGTFTNITANSGLFPCYSYGLAITNIDANSDGLEDLYFSNDFIENDYLYINQGNGRFSEQVKQYFPHTSFYSMGTDASDINNDGLEDLLVVEMRPEDYKRSKTSMPLMDIPFMDSLDHMGFHRQYMHNVLHLNYGIGKYGDVAQMLGVDKTDWSWAALMADFNLDGLKDIFITNGFRMDVYDRDGVEKVRKLSENKDNKMIKIDGPQNLFEFYPAVKLANYIYQNLDGLSFQKKTVDWGVAEPSYSNGASWVDLDNDGDLDLVINNIDEEAFIYKNNENSKRWIKLSLEGPAGNLMGIGAKAHLISTKSNQMATMRLSRGYLSCSQAVLHFGIQEGDTPHRIELTWPDGKRNVIEHPVIGKEILVKYAEASSHQSEISKDKTIFKEVSDDLISPAFYHQENKFDDYKKQILLPHRMSRLGPFISTGDVNQDGLEDFFIGGAKSQAGAIYTQRGDGRFEKSSQKSLEADRNYEDMGSAFFDADGDKDLDLYVVSGGTEHPEGKAYQDRLYLNNGSGIFTKSASALPEINSSGSCVLIDDWDQDGDLDIFRGGRTVPDQYPFAPESYFLENNGAGKFNIVKETLQDSRMGMVSSGLFLDLDGDQQKELIVCGEWMPIKILKRNGKSWKDISTIYPAFANTEGWWNHIQTFDADQDGDMDLIAGNLGENYKFHASVEKPFEVFCSDYDQNGSYDVFLAKHSDSKTVPIRGRQCASEQLPLIKTKFPSFRAFADADIKDLLGEGSGKSVHLQVKNFQSAFFIRDGNDFKMQSLPRMAQIAPVQSAVIFDWDGDSNPEILCAGNLMHSEIETTRADAGIGYYLKKLKDGSWESISSATSGIKLHGDVRDMKPIQCKFGKAVLVSQNNGKLLLLTYQ